MYIFQSEQVIKLRFCSKKKHRWYLSRLISIHWIVMWGAILGRYIRQNQPTKLPSWRLPCYRYGMICHRSSLIRQSYHFERDFDSVLLHLADTLNTQFKYRYGSWHSLLKRFKCIRKTCRKFDSLLSKNYWIFSMRQHVHLKKWTLKFKNCCIYWTRRTIFNKICRICGLNPHLLPSQIWWIYLPQFQRYRIFPRGLLFWRALYVYTRYNNMRYKNHRAQPIACCI